MPAVRRACVPVLMYHHIADPGNAMEMVKLWFVTPERFAEQMEWLHHAGFHTISPQQLREHLEKGTDLPSRPIVITFDDGWGDQYANAYPVLKRLGMSGVFYVYSGGMNAPGYMSWDQLREMQAAGMVIGSHTISHPDLTGLDDAAVMKELTESKAAIAKNLERPCDDFAYPYGQFDDRIMKLTNAAGYTTSMGTEPGFTQRQDELLELRRMRVSWHESIVTFKALIPSPEEQTRRP